MERTGTYKRQNEKARATRNLRLRAIWAVRRKMAGRTTRVSSVALSRTMMAWRRVICRKKLVNRVQNEEGSSTSCGEDCCAQRRRGVRT